MRNRVLKSHTIIPDQLYVSRDADYQLSEIISDMGRPGYVLVARQMGKTNLLLNAKRTLQGKEDAFVYIDLSNTFNSARECFRYIIDISIETHADKFSYQLEEINKQRALNLPDHIEHINELRKLLSIIRGKLVIVLDEVDALTKGSFSDTVFKQIRSVYFSRANYEELSRLTYVLSGVAEPTSLIKDPRISPFNIGESIFLGDFNYEEFTSFLDKANLSFDDSIKSRIFYWSNGNPRITYDICASLETEIIKNTEITIVLIDKIVHQLYHISFDRAPVDHIRELVNNDSELRSAVLSVWEGRSELIKDTDIRKLYLAGIIGPVAENQPISIKNNVISKAISLPWVQEIENRDDYILQKCKDLFSLGRFEEAINVLKDAFTQASGIDQLSYRQVIINFLFISKKYRDIISFYQEFYHNADKWDTLDRSVRKTEADMILEVGLSFFHIQNHTKALEFFGYISKAAIRDSNYIKALLYTGNTYQSLETEDNLNNSLFIYEKLLEELNDFSLDIETSLVNESRAIAFYNIGRVNFANNKPIEAKDNFSKALNRAITEWKPQIFHYLFLLEEDETKKLSILIELTQYITENKIKPQSYNPSSTLNLTYALVAEILRNIAELDQLQNINFIDFIRYLIISDSTKFGIFAEKSVNEPISPIDMNDREFIINIYYNLFINFYKVLSFNTKIYIYRSFRTHSLLTHALKYGGIFIDEVINSRSKKEITSHDIDFISAYLNELVKTNDYIKSEQLVDKMSKIYPNLSPVAKCDFIIFDFITMELYEKSLMPIKAFISSKKIINQIIDFNVNDSIIINDETVTMMSKVAIDKYNKWLPVFDSTNSKNVLHNRNTKITVVYNDGKVISDKYKRLANDIDNGFCRIIL